MADASEEQLTALPGITWGVRAMDVISQALDHFPRCLERCPAGEMVMECEEQCARTHGVFDALAVHMRSYRRTWQGRPLEEVVERCFSAEGNWSGRRVRMLPQLRWRLCCDLVHKNLAACQYGCIPWRPVVPRAPLCPGAP